MSGLPTLRYRYMGEGEFRALPRYHELCDMLLVTGEVYSLAFEEERSSASHNHYFASVKDAFDNLPEHLAPHFRNPEHLRKWTLIRTGWCTSRSAVFESPHAAAAAATWAGPQYDANDVVLVEGNVVTVFRARSQSVRAMKSKDFQRSKSDVLDHLHALLRIDPRDLEQFGVMAA